LYERSNHTPSLFQTVADTMDSSDRRSSGACMSEMDIYNRTQDVSHYFKLPYDSPPEE
jgi:hypothetical protein